MTNPRWEEESWYPQTKTLQEDKTIAGGILDGQDADYDDAQSNARHQNNTPETTQGDFNTEKQMANAMGDLESRHPGACAENTRGGDMRNAPKPQRNRNNATCSQTSRDAERAGTKQRRSEPVIRTNVGISNIAEKPRKGQARRGAAPTLHMHTM